MKQIKVYVFLFWFLVVGSAAFATGVQIDFLLAGLRNPLTDAFLANGLVYTYAAGTTASKSVYMDAGLASASTNPIVLDAYGRAVRYANGKYKFVVKTSAGSILWTWDNLEYSSCATLASQTTNPFGATMKVTNFTTPNLTATLAADLNANGYAIHNVATATLPYDLVTLGYVDQKNASMTETASQTTYDLYQEIAYRELEIASITPVIHHLPASATSGTAFTNCSLVIGSGTWIDTTFAFTHNNLTSEDQYFDVSMSGYIVITAASTSGLIYGMAAIGMRDNAGNVYDMTYAGFSDDTTLLASPPTPLRTAMQCIPFHLSSFVKVAAGSSKDMVMSYRDVEGVSATIRALSDGRWVRWRRYK